ncbi:MAG TPA: phosphotransferase [Thermoanaerobaculia bacterium]|nr:phosphotransferase [Thermoanaerobaculia bacterium]
MGEALGESLPALVQSTFGTTDSSCSVTPIGGGLESSVAHVRFAVRTAEGRSLSRSAVVKRVEGFHRREAAFYRALSGAEIAPRLLAAIDRGEVTYLFLEAVRPVSFIHGDAHPGNVLLREQKGRRTVVFLDWARSRFGSPLEDVASWLETLRYWEATAARHHDSLLRHYLDARGGRPLDRSLRDAYWIACASNVLAGALRFHLLRATEARGRRKHASVAQAREALRVIRRADAVMRG